MINTTSTTETTMHQISQFQIQKNICRAIALTYGGPRARKAFLAHQAHALLLDDLALTRAIDKLQSERNSIEFIAVKAHEYLSSKDKCHGPSNG